MLCGWFGHILQDYLLPHEWSYLHHAHDERQLPYFTEPQFLEFLTTHPHYEFTKQAIAHATLHGYISVLERVNFCKWSTPQYIRSLETLIWYERKGWMYDSQYDIIDTGQVNIDVLAYLEITQPYLFKPLSSGNKQNIQWLFDHGCYYDLFYRKGVALLCEQGGDLSNVDWDRIPVFVGNDVDLSLCIYKHQTPAKRAWMEVAIETCHFYMNHIGYLKLVPNVGWNDLFLRLIKTKDDVEYLQHRFGICPFTQRKSDRPTSKIILRLHVFEAALWTKDVKLTYDIRWNFAIPDEKSFDLLMGEKTCQEIGDIYNGNDLKTWRMIWNRCKQFGQTTTFHQNSSLLKEMTHRDINCLIKYSKKLKLVDCELDAMKSDMLKPFVCVSVPNFAEV